MRRMLAMALHLAPCRARHDPWSLARMIEDVCIFENSGMTPARSA
jgi:hypothetical protein